MRWCLLLVMAFCASAFGEEGLETAWNSDAELREFFALVQADPDDDAALKRKREDLLGKAKLIKVSVAYSDARLVAEDGRELRGRGLYRGICWTAGDVGSNRGVLYVPPRLAYRYLCILRKYEYGESRPDPELVASVDHRLVRDYFELKMKTRCYFVAPENNPDQRISPKGTLEQEQEIIRVQDGLLAAGILIKVNATIRHGKVRGVYLGSQLRRIGLECGWDWNTFGSSSDATCLSLTIPNGCVEKVLADIMDYERTGEMALGWGAQVP
jgi:hypothetical protein